MTNNKVFNFFKKHAFLILFAFVFIVPFNVYAGSYKIGFETYLCDGSTPAKANKCVSDYFAGKLTKVNDGVEVERGQSFMNIIKYDYTYTSKEKAEAATTAMIRVKYDDKYVSPVSYYDEDDEKNVYIARMLITAQNPAYNFTLNDGSNFYSQYAGSSFNVVPNLSLVAFTYQAADPKNSTSLYSTPAAVGATFFKVREDAELGKTFQISLSNDADKLTSFSTAGNERVNFTYTPFNIKVAGGSSLSKDNTLKTLTFTGSNGKTYIAKEGFTAGSDNTTYNLVVPADVDSITIDSTTNDAKAQFIPGNKQTFNHSYTLKTGANTLSIDGTSNFAFTVSSESGDQQDFTINVYRLSDDTTLSSLSASGINKITTTNYSNITVPYKTTGTTLRASATNNKAFITEGYQETHSTESSSYSKNWSLNNAASGVNDNYNTKTLTVNAENCRNEYKDVPGNSCTHYDYTISVKRTEASHNANLSSLRAGTKSIISSDTAPDANGYTLDNVPNSTTTLTVSATKADDKALTIEINGNSDSNTTSSKTINLVEGDNTIPVTVTAEDGSTKNTYNIKVRRMKKDATLKTLDVTSVEPTGTPAGTLVRDATDIYKYTYTYDSTTTKIHVKAIANDDNAAISGAPSTSQNSYEFDVTDFSNPVTVTVTSEDASDVQNYVINFSKKLDENNSLSGLSLTDVTPNSSNKGNVISIGDFSTSNSTYSITVPGTVSTVHVGASLSDTRASFMDGYGPRDVNLEYNTDNRIEVRIQSEAQKNAGDDTKYQTYTIIVHRDYKDIKSLESININNTTICSGNCSTTADYGYSIRSFNNDSIKVSATVTDSDSSYDVYTTDLEGNPLTIDDDGNISVPTGTHDVVITVTAQDRTTQDYKVSVTRPKNNDASLGSISVKNQVSTPECNGTSCTVTVSNEQSTLTPADVTVVPNDNTSSNLDGKASVTNVTRSVNLSTKDAEVKNNVYKFIIVPESGNDDSKEYTLTVTRTKSSDNGLSSVTAKTKEGKTSSCTPNADHSCTISVASDTTGYSLSWIPSNTEATTVLRSLDAKTTYSVPYDFTMGGAGDSNQTLVLVVTPEDGSASQSYQIHINRAKSSNSNLKSFTLNTAGAATINSTNYKSSYEIHVDGSTSYKTHDDGYVLITPTVEDTNKTSIIKSTKDSANGDSVDLSKEQKLNYGNNRFFITLQAEDGSTKQYDINIIRDEKVEPRLDDLKVNLRTSDSSSIDTTVNGFNKDAPLAGTETYSYDDSNHTSLGSLNELNAIYTTASIDITPVSKDTEFGQYTISNDRFDDNDASYKDSGVTTKVRLKTGLNTITVVSYAHNKTISKTYVLKVYRKAATASDVSFASVVVAGKDITSTMKKSGNAYTFDAEVENDVTVADGRTKIDDTLNTNKNVYITLGGKANGADYDTFATVGETQVRLKSLKKNNDKANTYSVGITVEDGTTIICTINIKRKNNSDNSLQSLAIKDTTNAGGEGANVIGYLAKSDQSLFNTTDPDGTVYSTTIGTTYKDYFISAIPTKNVSDDYNSPATVNYAGLRNIGTNLSDQAIIEVVAEDGSKRSYTINVSRTANDDTTLSYLGVKVGDSLIATNETLNERLSNGTMRTNYTVTVPAGTTSLTVNATPSAGTDYATVTGTGAKTNVSNGSEYQIIVKSKDNDTKTTTYNLKVNVLPYSIATLNKLQIDLKNQEGFKDVAGFVSDKEPAAGTDTISLPDLNVKNNVSSFDLKAVTTNDKASIKIINVTKNNEVVLDSTEATGNVTAVPLNDGNNKFNIVVTAEDGQTVVNYNLNIVKAYSNNNDATISVYDTGEAPYQQKADSSNSDILNITVPAEKEKITASMIHVQLSDKDLSSDHITMGSEKDGDSDVKGAQEIDLVTKKSVPFYVKVTAADNTPRIYTLNFIRTASSDNNLKSFVIDNPNIASVSNQTITIPVDTPSDTKFKFTATAGFNAKISDDDGKTYTDGNSYTKEYDLDKIPHPITLTVKAEDGKTKKYTYNVIAPTDQDSSLSSIVVKDDKGASYTLKDSSGAGFSSSQTDYTIGDVQISTVSKLTVTPTVSATGKATISGYEFDGTLHTGDNANIFDVTEGEHTIRINVTANDGTSSYYTIKFTGVKSSNVYLSKLQAKNGSKEIAFDNGIKFDKTISGDRGSYVVTVPYDTQSISFDVATEDKDATVSIDGENFFGNTTLNNPHTFSTGALKVNPTDNIIMFTVKAADGKTTSTYKVNVIRQNEVKNQDSSIKENGITVTGKIKGATSDTIYTLDKKVVAGTSDYLLKTDVPYKTYQLVVNAVPNAQTSSVIYKLNPDSKGNCLQTSADGIINLKNEDGTLASGVKDGENTIDILITAEDKNYTKHYSVTFNYSASKNNYLKSLEDSLGKITNFNGKSNNRDYKVTVPEGTDKVTLTMVAEDPNALISFADENQYGRVVKDISMETLSSGSNVMNITVTSESGMPLVYTVDIYKEAEEMITSKKFGHVIEDGMIKTVRVFDIKDARRKPDPYGDETALQLKNELDNDNSKLKIFDTDGNEISDTSNLATGMIVKLYKTDNKFTDSNVADSKTIVVKGDANGDGRILLNDATTVLYHTLSKTPKFADRKLSGPYLEASDVTDGTAITDFSTFKISYDGNVLMNDAVIVLRRAIHQVEFNFNYNSDSE